MFFLYSTLIRLYYWLMQMAALIHPKAKLWVRGRRQQHEQFQSIAKKWADQQIIMIHAASYGEYEMAKPIVKALLVKDEVRILVSFYSPSGYEHTHFEDNRIEKIYLPADLISHQEALIDIIKPKKVVFIKYEFWFNLLSVLNQRDIPYYYTSLHLNTDAYLFRGYMSPFLNLIKKSRKIYCHNPESQAILKERGFSNTAIMGDTRIQQAKLTLNSNKGWVKWNNDNPTIAFGSLIESEFSMLSDVLTTFPKCNFLIAPHDIDSETIAKLQRLTGPNPKLYSELKSLNPKATLDNRILIIDTLGDLKFLYKNVDIAYIGAGFEKGPHNVIESLIYGVPAICGSNIKKFPMAQHLQNKKLLRVIESPQKLNQAIGESLNINRAEFKKSVTTELNNLEANINELVKELSPN